MDMATYEGINVGVIFDGFYWGGIVSFILSGITILQAWLYFPSKDATFIQLIASMMIILDVASTGLVAHGMYHYFIPHFGSLLPLGSLVETLSVECTLSVIIIVTSQLYFAWQIYTVSKNPTVKYGVSALVVLFALVSFGGGLACSIVMILDKKYVLVTRSYKFSVTAGISKGASAVSDTIATVALCWTLGNVRTGIKQTDSLLKTLISFVIQRGILVTMIQTVFLIIFFSTSAHTYWLALHINVTRIYANTFFAMLNGRNSLKSNNTGSYGINSGTQSHSTYIGNSTTGSKHEKIELQENADFIHIGKSVHVSNV